MKRVLKIAQPLLAALLILLVLLVLTLTLLNRASDRPTFFFDRALLWVETGSMEPAIPARSFILVQESDGVGLAEGTVITFRCADPASEVYGRLITHRIVSVTDAGYLTRGDATQQDPWVVAPEDVCATLSRTLPGLTACGRIFASPIGLVLILAVFFGSMAFLYLPELIRAITGSAAERRERELEKRVMEEVQKLKENEKKEGDE